MKQELLGLVVALAFVAGAPGLAAAKTGVDAGAAGGAAGLVEKDLGNGGSMGLMGKHGPKGGGNVARGTKKGRAAHKATPKGRGGVSAGLVAPLRKGGTRAGLKDGPSLDKSGGRGGAQPDHGPKGGSGKNGG